MAYQGEPIRTETIHARMHRLDRLRVAYGQLERQMLGLQALEAILRHPDWIRGDENDAAMGQWQAICAEVLYNVAQIWELSAPAQDQADESPF